MTSPLFKGSVQSSCSASLRISLPNDHGEFVYPEENGSLPVARVYETKRARVLEFGLCVDFASEYLHAHNSPLLLKQSPKTIKSPNTWNNQLKNKTPKSPDTTLSFLRLRFVLSLNSLCRAIDIASQDRLLHTKICFN